MQSIAVAFYKLSAHKACTRLITLFTAVCVCVCVRTYLTCYVKSLFYYATTVTSTEEACRPMLS